MDDLVYDRTKQNKGKLSVDMLNRIESWTEFLSDRLKVYGYNAPVSVKKDWKMSDIFLRRDIDRIRDNINMLQDRFCRLPEWKEIVYNNTVDFNQANAMEWDLQIIDIWLGRMVRSFIFTGEIYAGEGV